MPNSIVPHDHDGQELFNAISSFFSQFKVGNLLRKCNAQKEKGVPVLQIFKYKLCNVFADRSMYMQQKTGSYQEAFSKNTFYRFLNKQEDQLAKVHNSAFKRSEQNHRAINRRRPHQRICC